MVVKRFAEFTVRFMNAPCCLFGCKSVKPSNVGGTTYPKYTMYMFEKLLRFFFSKKEAKLEVLNL